MRPSRERVWLLPAVAACAVRLVLFGVAAPHPDRLMIEPDSREYFTLARNLALGRGFSLAAAAPYEPDVRRTPVYPATLAALFAGSESVRAAAVMGIAAAVATVIAIARLTARLFGNAAPFFAAMLLAVDATSAAYSTQLLTEALFTLLVWLAVLSATDRDLPRSAGALVAGILSSLAALCRPIGLLFAPALLPAFLWRASAWQRAGKLLVVAMLTSAVPIGLWTIRNRRASGVTTFTSQAATNAYFHRAAYVVAELDGRPVEAVRAEWEREFAAASARWSERERIAWMNDHGASVVLAHPAVYLKVVAKGMARMARPDVEVLPPLLGLERDQILWRAVLAVTWIQLAIVYVLAARGAWLAWREVPAAAFVPLAVIAYFVVLAGPEMYPRFRVPMMPGLCMLAGVGLTRRAAWQNPANVQLER